MSSSNDLTKSVSAQVTAHVSRSAEVHDKAKAVAVSLGKSPFSRAAIQVDNATPSFNTLAVTVYQPPSPAGQEPVLWAVWSPFLAGEGGAVIAIVGHAIAGDNGAEWSDGVPVGDTLGNPVQSARTPALTVLDGQMHLVVVKPDGRGTLAHYVYIDSLDAWEYNSGWDVQPQTTASPSVTAFAGRLYLAFIADGAVNVCTYTPSTTEGVKYGPWSAPATTGVPSTQAPALFTSPRRTGAELHLAVAHPDTLVKEYAMGGSLAEWTQSALQPGGTTNGGVGACNTASEAFLAAETADDENPTLQYTVWTEDGNTWPLLWTVVPGDDGPLPTVFSDVTCAVFNGWLRCFYVGLEDDYFTAWVISVPLFGN